MSFTAGVNEQGIKALTNMAKDLQEHIDDIHQAGTDLLTAFLDNRAGLGPHAADIDSLLNDLEESEKAASVPVRKLCLKLSKAAALRQRMLENNPYK